MKSAKLGAAVAAICLIVLPSGLQAGSLEKFQLPPVQQSVPNLYQQKSAPPTEAVPDLPVYRNFQTYAETLTPVQIDQMITTYSQRKLQAVNNGDWDQASYYNNLVKILLNERRRR